MSCLPSPASSPSQLGIRQIAEEYQQRHLSRVHRARVSGAALLLAATTHVVLIAALVWNVIVQGSLFPVEHLVPYVGTNLCVAPFTWLLARLYSRSRAAVAEARARLDDVQSLRRRKLGSVPPAD